MDAAKSQPWKKKIGLFLLYVIYEVFLSNASKILVSMLIILIDSQTPSRQFQITHPVYVHLTYHEKTGKF